MFKSHFFVLDLFAFRGLFGYNIYMLSEQKKNEIIDEMIDFLVKENGLEIKADFDYAAKREILNKLTLLTSGAIESDYFLALQDKLLGEENKKATRLAGLKFKGGVAESEAELFGVDADLVVYFSHQLFAVDLNESLDNLMILRAGVQVRNDFLLKFREDGFTTNFGEPYFSEGYNLPAKYIAKIVVNGEVCEDCIKKVFDFALENELEIVFFDLNNINIDKEKIIKLKPKNIKIVFKINKN